MRFFLACFACLCLLASCGARTDLGGGKSGEAGVTCTLAPWIVFDLFGVNPSGLAAVRTDGTGFHMLDLGGERAFAPAVSPDGASLLYITSNTDGTEESLVLRELASGKTRTIVHVTLAPPSSGLGKAAVSPDSQWIAYGNSPDLRLAKLDGSGDHLLVSGPYEQGCCPWSYGRPQFSGDSSLIYFSTIGRLESIHTDGSGRQLLYQDQFFTSMVPGFVFPNVSLSPDKTKLVAQVACDVSALRIFDVNALPADPCATGTKLVETGISMAPNEASNPSWGPTNLIAYDDDKDVFLIDTSGGAKTNLTAAFTTEGAASASDPAWVSGCANLP